MKSKQALYIVVALAALIIIVILVQGRQPSDADKPVPSSGSQAATSPAKTASPAPSSGTTAKPAASGSTAKVFTGKTIVLPIYYAQQISSSTLNIHVSQPPSNTVVKSPLIVAGEARGTWFFEASFPVIITDKDRRIIGTGIAQAKNDWMTNDFVPFSGVVAFPPQKTGSKGFLIFKKDNPSGLAKNDAAVEIAVTF